MDPKLAALLRIRKRLDDSPGDPSGNIPATNLTSPEEYEQMPEDLQNIIKEQTKRSSGYRIGNFNEMNNSGMETSNLADRMSQEISNQDVSDGLDDEDAYLYALNGTAKHYPQKLMPYVEPRKFSEILNLLKSKK